MIRSVRLCTVKTHVDTTIDLGPLTVLVGPNGAGKSSVLTALHLLGKLRTAPFVEVFTHDHDPESFARRGADGFSIVAAADDGSLNLSVGSSKPLKNTLLTMKTPDGGEVGVVSPQTFLGPTLAARFPDSIASTAALRLDARQMARPAPVRERPRVALDGSGLAAVIADLILTGADALPAIIEDTRRVVPQVNGLRVRTVTVPAPDPTHPDRTQGAMQLLVDFDGARGIPAHAVSEGTLIAIGLLTVLHSEPRPRLLLLDDIDQGLHPKAQWELVAALRRVLAAHPDLQIIATTHSPYLVDELTPDEVRVLALDPDGVTHCRALGDHPRAAALLDVLSTGELLSAEGEDWVIGKPGA